MPEPSVSSRFLYVDDDILVIDKPAGISVHEGAKQAGKSLDRIISEAMGRPVYLVHRLDRETSGVLVFALNVETAARFGSLMAGGEVRKRYIALVKGNTHKKGTIRHPLSIQDGGSDKKEVEAVTRYHRLQAGRGWSLLSVEPLTGRTHQIRRHLSHIGHPVLGDKKWGHHTANLFLKKASGLERLFLHSARIQFRHPRSRQDLIVEAPLPPELQEALEKLSLMFGRK